MKQFGNFISSRSTQIILILLVLTGAFLRFYNLNWGAPFYFHPDERNIANSVAQISFPDQLNPNFFAYGSLPIYTIYFTGVLKNLLTNTQNFLSVSFENAIIISRFYSAIFSALLIPLLYFTGKKIKDEKTGILTAFLATFSTGFVQFAHFGTFEMWLTFFGALLFWLALTCLKTPKIKIAILMGLVFGILLSTKVSSLILLPFPLLVIFLKKSKTNNLTMRQFKNFVLFSLTTAFIFLLSNPFTFLDFSSFISSMKYESALAAGTLPVFYTGGFYSTTPVIYHFNKVFPFLLNPALTVLFIPTFFYLLYLGARSKAITYWLLVIVFSLLFLSQAFLFVKWVRYMMPALPFAYLIISIAIVSFLNHFKKVFSIRHLILSILVFSSLLFSLSYFITSFVRADTRIEAAEYFELNFPNNSRIITEPYDLGIMPFNTISSDIRHFNLYDLDSQPELDQKLQSEVAQAEYIVLPSQRLLRSRLLSEKEFPKGYKFYSGLTSGSLGFEKIYETPCDIFCRITYINDPVFQFEETANVFDRPTVMIFKKTE